ncbi:MAG: NAD(P)H-dependent oxidoreductase [Salinimicrobium sp.]
MRSVEALQWRYATKKFDSQRTVSPEKLNILKRAFNLTATSYGLQPLKLIIVRNEELQQKLQKASYNQKQLSTASHVLVICIEQEVNKSFIEKYFKYVRDIRNTPEDILNPFKESLIGDFEKKPLEEIYTWATHQAYLVLGTLLTVCAIEGIDSCPMEGFEPKKYDEILNLTEHNLRSVLALPIGYRSQDDFFAELKKVRRPLEETIIEY